MVTKASNRYCVMRKASDDEGDSVSPEDLTLVEANALADQLQADNPGERYAVAQVCYRFVRWTTPKED